MTTTKQKPSKETLAKVLSYLVQDPVLANAMRSVGMAPNTIFVWAKLSRDGDGRFRLRWPDCNGAEIWFHDGITVARQMQCANFEATLRRDVTQGTPRVLRTPSGEPVYEIDHRLIALWEGDAESARTLGGIVDPFYKHDQDGARIPVIVYDAAPAALRQHAARSLLAGYNPSDRKEVDTRHSGGILVMKASKQGDETAVRPPYARDAVPTKPVTPLQADLLKRLEDLRANGPRNPKPSAPVHVHGRPADDPVERTAEPERTIDPREHPRAYRASGRRIA